jgi:putative ABC transport system permease protein
MAIILGLVIALLIGLTALVLVGLSSFNVTQRTKQIGTRRALGASRLDIIKQFILENWVITTVGAVFGCVLTVEIAYWLEVSFPRRVRPAFRRRWRRGRFDLEAVRQRGSEPHP